MTTLAEIFRLEGQKYIDKFGINILPSHLKAMQDIAFCRTDRLGGQIWRCEKCDKIVYSYHSCRNRHCPKCQNERVTEWLEKQVELMLPVSYFMATVTVPKGLRTLFRKKQKKMYSLLFKTSVDAIRTLARDKKYLGAEIGLMGVLQTWARNLVYHPHIHFLIPGGGISLDGKRWIWAKPDFFVHVKPLSILIRAKFKQALKDAGLFQDVPASVWRQKWVCHIEPVGNGENVLKYLAPYIFRVAISGKNILHYDGKTVTFRYKDAESKTISTCRLNTFEFMRRFLQHVLPRGFVKVRYYGFLATKKRADLDFVKELIGKRYVVKISKTIKNEKRRKCPDCGHDLTFIDELPKRRGPPLWKTGNP